MKNLFLFCCLIFVIIITGCSKEGIVDPKISDNESGNVSLQFNKTTAPANVAIITATLSRSGYTNITGNLNILTDTSASITLGSVPVGVWHLKIEAKDNAGTTLYSGETDVTVTASFVTQVSITLTAVAGSTGGIYIMVNWGISTSGTWVDYYGNPFLVGTGSAFDKNGVRRPYVVVEGNACKMWFANTDSSNISSVGYAVSSDGLSWQRGASLPVLGVGGPGKWDDGSMTVGPVIKVDGTYRMYYSGRSPIYGTIHIGLAFSTDGINWTKHPPPVLYAQQGWETNIDAGDVIKIGDLYYMYYSGNSSAGWKIGIATSPDGINWTRYSGNPILSSNQSWESGGVYIPSVIKVSSQYYMVYQSAGFTSSFGMAVSSDGISWVKNTNNPFFNEKNTSQNWCNSIMYPCLRMYNNEMRIYYSGGGTGLAVARKLN